MKNSKSLTELKREAAKNKSEDPKELIKFGSTNWYRGCAVDAPDEMIALRLSTGITIQFDEKDIIEVENKDDLYMIQVKEGTNYVASFQMTGKVGSHTESCGCNEQSKDKDGGDSQTNTGTPSQLRSAFGDDNGGFRDIFQPPGLGWYLCYNEPYLTEICFTYRDSCGRLQRFCYPYMTSRQVCKWV